MMSKHVMEMLGMSKVTIIDGKVVEVTEPKVKVCPLFKKHRGIDEINCEAVRKNAEYRIGKFGMCNDNRQIRMHDFLNFGVSEMLSLALQNSLINAAVIAADGCGTAVIDDPEIVQGMGGRISGIIETEPIKAVVDGIGSERILDPNTAKIEQFEGVEKAFAMHYHTVAVTVTAAKMAQEIRDAFGRSVVIIAVHTTGTSEEDAYTMFDCCDIITSCASKYIREAAKTKAILQAGTKVPVYAASEKGAEIIKAKLDELGKKPDTILEESPVPLI